MTIVLVCHTRVWHLEQVLSALKKANNFEKCNFLIVAQDPSEAVKDVLALYSPPDTTILIRSGEHFESTHHAINSNVHFGIMHAFENNKADFVILLEDDIIPSVDFIDFFYSVFCQHRKKRYFRGVNAFSSGIAKHSETNAYVKINFGLGWGWGIPRKTYEAIGKYWSGEENEHWDFLFEPYIRTGYVLNPVRSRILNIGFDDSATHSGGDQQLGESIKISYNSALPNNNLPYLEIKKEFLWQGYVGQYCYYNLKSIFLSRFINRILFQIYAHPKSRKFHPPVKHWVASWIRY